MEKSTPDRTQIAVLIHGTWGRGYFRKLPVAKWCDKDSDLRQSVERALGPEVVFVPLNWSGRNSPAARLAASDLLAAQLDELRLTYPDADIHLIAHSHGGNAALYCLNGPTQQANIASLTCLSTPFLHVRTREYGTLFGEQLNSAIALLFLSPYLAFVAWFIWRHGQSEDPIVILGLTLILIVGWLAHLFTKRVTKSVRQRAKKLAEKLVLPSTLPFPVLIVRSTADEASSALSGPQLLSLISTKVLRFTTKYFVAPPRRADMRKMLLWRFSIWALVITILAIPILALNEELWRIDWIDSAAVGVLGILILALVTSVAALAAYPITWIITGMLAVLMIPYGPSTALTVIDIEISAEGTPPGRWEIVQISGSNEEPEESRGSQHSTYAHSSALLEIEQWLQRLQVLD